MLSVTKQFLLYYLKRWLLCCEDFKMLLNEISSRKTNCFIKNILNVENLPSIFVSNNFLNIII